MEVSGNYNNQMSPIINLSGKEIPVEIMNHISSFCNPLHLRKCFPLINKQFNAYYKSLRSPVINLSGKEFPGEILTHIFSFCNPLQLRLCFSLVNRQFSDLAKEFCNNNISHVMKTVNFARTEFEHQYTRDTNNPQMAEWLKLALEDGEPSEELSNYLQQRCDLNPFFPGWGHKEILRHPNFSRASIKEAEEIIRSGAKTFLLRPSTSYRKVCTISYLHESGKILHQRVKIKENKKDGKFFKIAEEVGGKIVTNFYSLEALLRRLNLE